MRIIYSADMSIYIIRSNDLSLHDFYIGSTENMRDRGYQHKTNCKNEKRPHYNAKVYKFIRANGGWDNFQMVKIASVWGKATKSLFQIEQDYIYQYKPTLNCIRSYRSKEEKRVYRKEYNKEYKEKYKEVLNEKKKENYEKNKDRILEKQKENRKINKDIISEKRKKYYENNKEKYKEKITCDCGSTFIKVSKARHYKTKKHKSFIENN